MEITPETQKLILLLIPVVLVQLGLMVAALIDWSKRTKFKGSKWLWLVVILFVNIIGPILYFTIARKDE